MSGYTQVFSIVLLSFLYRGDSIGADLTVEADVVVWPAMEAKFLRWRACRRREIHFHHSLHQEASLRINLHKLDDL